MSQDHDVMLAIGRLEGKLDSLIQLRQQQQQEIKDLDTRVRALESAKSLIIGGAGVVSGAVTILLNLFNR